MRREVIGMDDMADTVEGRRLEMSGFGECDVDKVPPLEAWGDVGRMAVLGVVSAFSKFITSIMNRTTCTNYETFYHHVTQRRRPNGLITVSNHASTFDDPGLLSWMIPWRYFLTEPTHRGIRWTMCTSEICAKNALVHKFFAAGKTVPITRGGGVNQAVMGTMAERVSRGDWLHIFPEGRVTKVPNELGRLKWGLGKMLCDIDERGGPAPTVLPFWHSGMEKVKRYGVMWFYPFNHVHVTVGEPIDFADLTARCGKCKTDKAREELFRSMTDRVEERMREIRAKNLEERHARG